MFCPLIFSRYFLFHYCSQILQWEYIVNIQMRSCVQQKHMLRLETDLCSMRVHGQQAFGFPGRRSWEMEGNSLSCRHKGPWWELAVRKSYMALAGGVLSKWTKCWTVLSHTEVSHGSKTLQTTTERNALPAKQFNHSRHGKERNMK